MGFCDVSHDIVFFSGGMGDAKMMHTFSFGPFLLLLLAGRGCCGGLVEYGLVGYGRIMNSWDEGGEGKSYHGYWNIVKDLD